MSATKTAVIGVVLWTALGLFCGPANAASDPWDLNLTLSRTIDIEKVGREGFTGFIENAFWPPQGVIDASRVARNAIPAIEIYRLKNALNEVLTEKYRPAEAVLFRDVIGVRELRGGNDYLLLQYETDDAIIRIEDGKGLNVLWKPKRPSTWRIADVTGYVNVIVQLVLTCPTADTKGKPRQVLVSTVDIGKSKIGNVYFASLGSFAEWYQQFGWWSDAESVLFSISKWKLVYHLDFSGPTIPNEIMSKPRRFGKSPYDAPEQ